MFPYTISQNSITVLINGVPKVVDVSHPNYKAVYSAIKEGRWSDIESLIDVVKAVVNFAKGKIQIVNGVVYYEGTELHNYAVSKLLGLMKEGFNVNPLINFLSNLLKNPSYRAVQELYQFLEKGERGFVDRSKIAREERNVLTRFNPRDESSHGSDSRVHGKSAGR